MTMSSCSDAALLHGMHGGLERDEAPDLSRAGLRGLDLSGFNLSRADLQGADLRGTNLSQAGLSDANLEGANLFKAVLDAPTWLVLSCMKSNS